MEHPQQAISSPFRKGFSPQTAVDALYLHLPFCFHKCHYCDFYSVVEQPGHDRQAAFTEALIAELRQWAEHLDTLAPQTIFAGGGTPTYLRPELWGQLLEAMHRLGLLDRCEEFTVEANPETVTPELMQQLAAGGVNRVSIGAQSFQRESLQALERWHDPDNVPRAVEACRAAGLDNFSLDLIFAIPGQTLDMLDDDLSRLVALSPKHLSTYGLTYEPNTALTARLRVGKVTPIDEDTQREMYQHVLDRLEAEGFEHYEVSNWARTGISDLGLGISDLPDASVGVEQPPASDSVPEIRNPKSEISSRCLHNLAYWQNRNWLGAGPAAASHLDGQRWRNTPNLATYLASCPDPETQDHEQLPEHERTGERLMLGLRLSDGLPLDWIETHLPADDRRRRAIDEMIDIDMLERTDTHLRLTRRGLFVADSVIAKLL
ncbi:radical SAM family heme chaperone HemW [Algisphaera agarilytica]|uniref:Heme chaperone HemW n=1 Tax=Algisphaera agarilytica TaxID=1385975 RepID=A0A7X0LK26_9BACT|nr:radical SAM family heme chaperone HemW [Algisphaera agarilytica]MBB6428523.1 oxygen-independent coproporphyrinogen-3 oxidase [Algisphaera agarilytica]